MARKAGTTATMWQVAERAGVSQATVSLVLNNVGGSRVNEATRERVMDAVRELGYRTNAFAKSLRSGESRHDRLHLRRGRQLALRRPPAQGRPAARVGDGQRHPQRRHLQRAGPRGGGDRHDAVVPGARASSTPRCTTGWSTCPPGCDAVPTVVVNAQDRAGRVPSVFPDEELGGYAATRHLIEAGHTAHRHDQHPAPGQRPARRHRPPGRLPPSARRGGHRRRPPLCSATATGIVEDGLALTLRAARAKRTGRRRSSAATTGRRGARTGPWSRVGLRVAGGLLDRRLRQSRDDRAVPRSRPHHHRAALRADGSPGPRTSFWTTPPKAPKRTPVECSLILRGSVASAKVRA